MAPATTTKARKAAAATSTSRASAARKENAAGATAKARPRSAPSAAKRGALGNKTNASQNTAQLQAALDKLKAENMALKSTMQQQALTTPGVLVPRPLKKKGQAIRMIESMNLLNNRDLYNAIRRFVRFAALRAGIDFNGLWREVDKEKLVYVITSARERYRILRRFAQTWPVEEILKIQLKNHRQYMRRLAKAMDEALGEAADAMEIDHDNFEVPPEDSDSEMVNDDDEDAEDAEGAEDDEAAESDAEMASDGLYGEEEE